MADYSGSQYPTLGCKSWDCPGLHVYIGGYWNPCNKCGQTYSLPPLTGNTVMCSTHYHIRLTSHGMCYKCLSEQKIAERNSPARYILDLEK
jgi:hypothetical protein